MRFTRICNPTLVLAEGKLRYMTSPHHMRLQRGEADFARATPGLLIHKLGGVIDESFPQLGLMHNDFETVQARISKYRKTRRTPFRVKVRRNGAGKFEGENVSSSSTCITSARTHRVQLALQASYFRQSSTIPSYLIHHCHHI